MSRRAWHGPSAATSLVTVANAASSALTMYRPGPGSVTWYRPSRPVDVPSAAPPTSGVTETMTPGSRAWPAETIPATLHGALAAACGGACWRGCAGAWSVDSASRPGTAMGSSASSTRGANARRSLAGAAEERYLERRDVNRRVCAIAVDSRNPLHQIKYDREAPVLRPSCSHATVGTFQLDREARARIPCLLLRRHPTTSSDTNCRGSWSDHSSIAGPRSAARSDGVGQAGSDQLSARQPDRRPDAPLCGLPRAPAESRLSDDVDCP